MQFGSYHFPPAVRLKSQAYRLGSTFPFGPSAFFPSGNRRRKSRIHLRDGCAQRLHNRWAQPAVPVEPPRSRSCTFLRGADKPLVRWGAGSEANQELAEEESPSAIPERRQIHPPRIAPQRAGSAAIYRSSPL